MMSWSSKELLEEFKKPQYQPCVLLQQHPLTPELIASLRMQSFSQHKGSVNNAKNDSCKRHSGYQSVRVDKKLRKIIDVDSAFAQSLDSGFRNALLNRDSKNKKKPSEKKKVKNESRAEIPAIASCKVIQGGSGVVLTCITSAFKPIKTQSASSELKKKLSQDHGDTRKKSRLKSSDVPRRNSHDEKQACSANVVPKPLLCFTIPKVRDKPGNETSLQDDGHIVRISGLPRHADRGFVSSLFDGCHITQVHFICLPNEQPEGKAYVEFHSDFDQQRALDHNDCSTGFHDLVVVKASRREMEWVLKRCKQSFQFSSKSEFVVQLKYLPLDCSSEDISSLLKDCRIVGVHFVLSMVGLFDGNAFVELSSAEDCLNASAKNKALVRENCVEVVRSSRQSLDLLLSSYNMISVGHDYIVWLRGLPLDCLSGDIRTFLSGCVVSDIHFTHSQLGNRSGECFVELSTYEDLSIALYNNNRYIGHNCIMVCRSSHGQMNLALRRNGKIDPSQQSTIICPVRESVHIQPQLPTGLRSKSPVACSLNVQPVLTDNDPISEICAVLPENTNLTGVYEDVEFVVVDECEIDQGEDLEAGNVQVVSSDKNTASTAVSSKNGVGVSVNLDKNYAVRDNTANVSPCSRTTAEEKSRKTVPSLLDLVVAPHTPIKAGIIPVSAKVGRFLLEPYDLKLAAAKANRVNSVTSLKPSKASGVTSLSSNSRADEGKVDTKANRVNLLRETEANALLLNASRVTPLASASSTCNRKVDAKTSLVHSVTPLRERGVNPLPSKASVVASMTLTSTADNREMGTKVSQVSSLTSPAKTNVSSKCSKASRFTWPTKNEVNHKSAAVNPVESLTRSEIIPIVSKASCKVITLPSMACNVISSTLLSKTEVPKTTNMQASTSLATAKTDAVPVTTKLTNDDKTAHVAPSRFTEKYVDSSKCVVAPANSKIPFILDEEQLPTVEANPHQPISTSQPPPASTRPPPPVSITCSEDEWQNLCCFMVERIDRNLVSLEIMHQLFEPFGQLQELQFGGKNLAIGRYSTPDAAHLAIMDMNGVQLGNSTIQVSLNKKKLPSFQLFHALMKQAELCNRIYVSNINRDVLQCDLNSAFRTVGNVTSCQLSVDPLLPSRNLGFAYFEYETAQMATDAIICLNLINFRGQSIRVGKAVTPANVQRSSLTPQWNRALSAATEVANIIGQRLASKRKSRFDSMIPSKLARKLSENENNSAAPTTVAMASSDTDLRVPHCNYNISPCDGDIGEISTATVACDEAVDKEAEKQRIMSLIARVSDMLRTGKLGPITPRDVNVTKLHFSSGVGSSPNECMSDRTEKDCDIRTARDCQSQERVSVIRERPDDYSNRGIQTVPMIGELEGRTSVDVSLNHAETSGDNFLDRDDRKIVRDIDDRGSSLDEVCSATHPAELKGVSSSWTDSRTVVFDDDTGRVDSTLDNGCRVFGGSMNASHASAVPNLRDEQFATQDVDLRNISSSASHDTDLRDMPPSHVSRDLEDKPLLDRFRSYAHRANSPGYFVVSRMLSQFGTSRSRRVSLPPNVTPFPENDEYDRWREHSTDFDTDERNCRPHTSAADSIDDCHDVDYRTLTAVRRQ